MVMQPPFRDIAYKLDLKKDEVRQAVDSLKRHGKIVVNGGVEESAVEIVD